MSLRSRVLLAATSFAVGCADLKDATILAQALRARYHVPVNVSINSGSHLVVALADVPANVAADSNSRGTFARDVATFAKHTYPHATALQDVTITLSAVRSAGPVTLTRTDSPYRWKLAELP